MKCKLHPKYLGVKRPTSKAKGCTCQAVYDYMNKKTPDFIGGKMRSINDWGRAGAESARHLQKLLGIDKHVGSTP